MQVHACAEGALASKTRMRDWQVERKWSIISAPPIYLFLGVFLSVSNPPEWGIGGNSFCLIIMTCFFSPSLVVVHWWHFSPSLKWMKMLALLLALLLWFWSMLLMENVRIHIFCVFAKNVAGLQSIIFGQKSKLVCSKTKVPGMLAFVPHD